tara:strand:+ start:157 stop:846 length:690 start_codon:yes stop_codon:yes gene_type:complete
MAIFSKADATKRPPSSKKETLEERKKRLNKKFDTSAKITSEGVKRGFRSADAFKKSLKEELKSGKDRGKFKDIGDSPREIKFKDTQRKIKADRQAKQDKLKAARLKKEASNKKPKTNELFKSRVPDNQGPSQTASEAKAMLEAKREAARKRRERNNNNDSMGTPRQRSLAAETDPDRVIGDPNALKDSVKGIFGKIKKSILGRNMGGSTNKNARDGLALRGTTKAVYRD